MFFADFLVHSVLCIAVFFCGRLVAAPTVTILVRPMICTIVGRDDSARRNEPYQKRRREQVSIRLWDDVGIGPYGVAWF